MKQILMARGARTLVDTCTNVKSNEKVVIVTDMTKVAIAEAVATAAYERGAEVVMTVMEPRKRAGQEPPEPVAAAMKTADVIFSPVSFSITHTQAVKDAVSGGARAIVMTDFTEEMMMGGGIEANFQEIKPICQGVARAFSEGSKVHVVTPGGTDLWLNASDRRGNSLYCVVEPGQFSTVPTVEANFSPVEDSAEGTIVCDASIPYLGIGIINEPLKITVKKGYITEIAGGGSQGERLRRNLAEQNDHNAYNIAELGVGLNPKCRMCGIMLEDEGVKSTAHIGIGTSITLGGVRKAPMHYDLIMWHPTITVDDKIIVDKEEVYI